MRNASESHATRQRLASHVDVEVEVEPRDVALTSFAPPSGATKKPRSRKARVSAEASEDGGAQRTGSPAARRDARTTRGGGRSGSLRLTGAAANRLGERLDAGKTLSVIPGALTNKQDGAIAWHYTSFLPAQRATAGRKFADLMGRGLWGYDELITALAEWAAGRDAAGSPHTAIGFTEAVARSYIAVIRERWRDEEKTEERAELWTTKGLRSIADILAGAAAVPAKGKTWGPHTELSQVKTP